MKITELNQNPVTERIYIRIADVRLVSPMSPGVGREDSIWSDHDVLRDSNGNFILSATTMAGNFRHSLIKAGVSPVDIENLFGDENTSEQSRLWISDTTIEEGKLGVRDGVALTPEKTTEKHKKFDFEIIDTGAKFTIRMEMVIRIHDDAAQLKKTFYQICRLLTEKKIQMGGKTTRGLGRIVAKEKKISLYTLAFNDKDALDLWLSFSWDNPNIIFSKLPENWKSELKSVSTEETMTILAELSSGILIRSDDLSKTVAEKAASIENGSQIMAHIHSNNNPVVPGTSWAGFFRATMRRMLLELPDAKETNVDELLRDVFGRTEKDDAKRKIPHASNIEFSESTIIPKDSTEGGWLMTTRTRINRFTGGVVSGALFTTCPWYLGTTVIEIRYPKSMPMIRELMLLALEDMHQGLSAIGGETGVGRGRFAVKHVKIDETVLITEANSGELLPQIEENEDLNQANLLGFIQLSDIGGKAV